MNILTEKDLALLNLINSYKPIGLPSSRVIFDEYDIPIYKLLLQGFITPPVYTLTAAGEKALAELNVGKSKILVLWVITLIIHFR